MYDEVSNPIHCPTSTSIDPNVEAVIDIMVTRADKGYKKYGTDTTRQDLTTFNWLTHLQEELLDAAIYIEVLKGNIYAAEQLPRME